MSIFVFEVPQFDKRGLVDLAKKGGSLSGMRGKGHIRIPTILDGGTIFYVIRGKRFRHLGSVEGDRKLIVTAKKIS